MIDPLSLNIPLGDSRPAAPVGPPRKLLVPSPTHPDDYLLEIDNSSYEPFSICQRKFENNHVLARQRRGTGSPLSFGRLFHICEEARLRHGLTAEVIAEQQRLCTEYSVRHPVGPEDHRSGDRMLAVLAAYNRVHASDGWPDRALVFQDEKFIERPFKVPLCTIEVNGNIPYGKHNVVANAEANYGGSNSSFPVRRIHVIWTGRIDLILSDANGLWVVDHKTTSSGGRDFEESFRLARQTVGYAWAAQQILQRPVIGLIVNAIIIRAPLKTARGTLPREEFRRPPFFYQQDRLDEWFQDMRRSVADLVTSLSRGHFPMTGPRSFMSPCVRCEYHENCQLPRSQRMFDLASDEFIDITWNPMNADE